jgi:uncharacterized membrane protein YdjX (TVP38/TMEM64 family)
MRAGSPGRVSGRARARGHLVFLAVALAAVGALAWSLGLHEWVRADRLAQLRPAIEAYGTWGPVLYVAGYVLAELLFVPALPLTLLGGLAFGPLWGAVYVSLASTLAAALAFLVARHLARDTVERWMEQSPRLARIDAAVERHGWRILMVTRLVPLFPFNLQNFVYGLTRIPFWTYVGVSWACMLPATVAFTLAGGALSDGAAGRTLWMLAGAAVLIALVSLMPAWLSRRSRVAGELLSPDR